MPPPPQADATYAFLCHKQHAPRLAFTFAFTFTFTFTFSTYARGGCAYPLVAMCAIVRDWTAADVAPVCQSEESFRIQLEVQLSWGDWTTERQTVAANTQQMFVLNTCR